MVKRFGKLVFIALLLLPGFLPTPCSQINPVPDYAQGRILLKIRPQTSIHSPQSLLHSLSAATKAAGLVTISGAKRLSFGPNEVPLAVSSLGASLDRWFVIEVPKTIDLVAELPKFRTLPFIEYAELDPITHTETCDPPPHGEVFPDDPYFSTSGAWGQNYRDLWGMLKIDAPGAWYHSTGDPNLVIAELDTGLDFSHEDLQGNIWTNTDEIIDGTDNDHNGYIDDVHGWNFVIDDNNPSPSNFHGSHVAGTILAVGNNSVGVTGVMWHGKIMALKTIGDNGVGTIAMAVPALRYAVDNGARVINNSWGVALYNDHPALREAIQYAAAQGAVIVAAAGNNAENIINSDHSFYPAAYDEVITIAATNELDGKCGFSNFGAKVDVAAPGCGTATDLALDKPAQNILSLIHAGADPPPGVRVGCCYRRASGTSMSSPHVSGLAGLLLSYRPNLNREQVRQILRIAASNVGNWGVNPATGYGRIDARQTLDLVDAITSTPRPELVIKGMQATPRYVVSRDTVSVTATLTNIGSDTALNFPVKLVGKNGSQVVVYETQMISSLAAGQSLPLAFSPQLISQGKHTLVIQIDPQGALCQYSQNNDTASIPVVVGPIRILEATLPGQHWGSTTFLPKISGRRIVWTELQDQVMLYDLGADLRPLTSDDQGPLAIGRGNSDANISDTRIAWSQWADTSNNQIVLYDLGPDGVFGTADDSGLQVIATGPGLRRPIFAGPNILWDSNDGLKLYDLGPDLRFGSADDRGLFSFLPCPGYPQTDGRLLAYYSSCSPNPGLYVYDLGPDGVYTTVDDYGPILVVPDLDGHYSNGYSVANGRLAWLDHVFPNSPGIRDSSLIVKEAGPDGRFGTTDDRPAVSLHQIRHAIMDWSYGQTDLGDNRLFWDDKRNGDWDVFFLDFGPDNIAGNADDREYHVTPTYERQEAPAHSGKLMVWQEVVLDLGMNPSYRGTIHVGWIEP